MTEFKSLIKKLRFSISVDQVVGFSHFIRRIEINYFEFSRSGLVPIIVSDFKDMNQAPINPFAILIFNQKISDWRCLINSNTRFIFKLKNFTIKIFSFVGSFQMYFQIKRRRESLFARKLQSVVGCNNASHGSIKLTPAKFRKRNFISIILHTRFYIRNYILRQLVYGKPTQIVAFVRLHNFGLTLPFSCFKKEINSFFFRFSVHYVNHAKLLLVYIYSRFFFRLSNHCARGFLLAVNMASRNAVIPVLISSIKSTQQQYFILFNQEKMNRRYKFEIFFSHIIKIFLPANSNMVPSSAKATDGQASRWIRLRSPQVIFIVAPLSAGRKNRQARSAS
mgnify:CR=1 FL=1